MRLNKFSKVLITSAVVGTFIFPSASGVSAAEKDPKFDYAYSGYAYELSSKNTYFDIDWNHVHRNPSSTADSVTYEVSRTKSTSANVSTSASFDAMVAQVGIGAEMGWGSSGTVATSITHSIPGHTTYKLRYGSRAVKTTGYEVRYSRGRVANKTWVNGRWTYSGYSDKIRL